MANKNHEDFHAFRKIMKPNQPQNFYIYTDVYLANQATRTLLVNSYVATYTTIAGT